MGTTWNNPLNNSNDFVIISDTNEVHDLCKSTYDYVNNVVWIFWKQKNSPKGSEILGTHIRNKGSFWSGNLQYISDLGSTEAKFHNFAVGTDGKVRAHYQYGSPSTLYYTQRNYLILNIEPDNTVNKLSVKIYPNPFSNNLFIDAKQQLKQIEIYNSIGRLVYLSKNILKGNKINLEKLPVGTYFLRLTGNDYSFNQFKLIKY